MDNTFTEPQDETQKRRWYMLKPAESPKHAIMRTILIGLIVIVIIWLIIYDEEEEADIDEISDIVKPGTVLYQTACELDGECRSRFVKMLKSTFEPEPSVTTKLARTIKNGLLAAVATEYVINGNLSKPLGVITKASMYSAISAINDIRKG